MKEKTISRIKSIVFQIAGWVLLLVATILFFFLLMEYYSDARYDFYYYLFVGIPFVLSLFLGIYYLWAGFKNKKVKNWVFYSVFLVLGIIAILYFLILG